MTGESRHWPESGGPGLLIGEAAALLGITQKAIRVYHASGVLPEPARDESGYRRYGSADLVALARISRLRAIGLPLKSIAPLVGARDGGAALRERLRALDATLEAEIAERAERRARIAQVLEEEIDDAIAVSAADVWEERSIALLRASIPDLTPEQERVERRFARALSALIPPQAATDEDEDEAVEAIAALASGSSLQEVATLHRRFHELAGAPEDDPRVEPLAAEFSRSFHALLERVLASLPEPEAWDPEPAEQERLRMGMAAALEVLSPAQRRVMELILASVVDGP